VSPAVATRSASGRFTAPPAPIVTRDELYTLWAVATAEANLAFDAWREAPGSSSYAVFLAAEDRASAAQDALAAHAAR
jgi:hypothetical protein